MEEKKQSRLGKVGGQAVLEGIMMRGPKSYTTAVRKADGTIVRDSHPNSIKKKSCGQVDTKLGKKLECLF